jgi:hypothetical protein
MRDARLLRWRNLMKRILGRIGGSGSESASGGAVARVIARWKSLGLAIRPGCSSRALDAFEARIGARLPADLREFLACANGLEVDQDGFSFWPLEEYETFAKVADEYPPNTPRVPDSGSYFVFCDYLTWCWGYAIRLRAEGEGDQESLVVPIGMNEMYTVARSFSEFLDLYLADSPMLYRTPDPLPD